MKEFATAEKGYLQSFNVSIVLPIKFRVLWFYLPICFVDDVHCLRNGLKEIFLIKSSISVRSITLSFRL